MIKIKKTNLNIFWYLIPLWIIGGTIAVILMNNKTNSTFDKYPLINSTNEVNSVIETSSEYKGTTLIINSKGNYFSIIATKKGRGPNVLHFFLEKGDSIARERNSNKLSLFKNKTKEVMSFDITFLE